MPVVPLARRAGTRTAVLAALTLAGTTLSGVRIRPGGAVRSGPRRPRVAPAVP
ncbi:hypothetical protein QFZ55_001745 [Streptomyces luteogriseus]|nr:hypothetical protein [Streptomyces luteogriseus]